MSLWIHSSPRLPTLFSGQVPFPEATHTASPANKNKSDRLQGKIATTRLLLSMLCFLLHNIATATAAVTVPLKGPDAGRLASAPISSFNQPLDIFGAPEGQHGRELQSCVRTGVFREPSISLTSSGR